MNPILQRNLAALSAADPALAGLLARTSASGSVRFLMAGGLAVPALPRDGRPRPLHSTVDPVREAARLAALQPAADYTVVLGLGGGYHLGPLLAGPGLNRLLVVEREASLVRAVLERVDLAGQLSDPRLRLLAGLPPQEVRRAVLEDYLPVLHGGLRTWPLRAAVQDQQDYYREVTRALQQAASMAAEDFAVQTRLGRRWFVNTIANLEQAAKSAFHPPAVLRAAVTGAGPSLEAQAAGLAALRREGVFLIATDASLPALLGLGLTPDLIVSIDCQLYSYHHFLQGLPPQVPLALDLSSPPVLGRLARRAFYFAGGHPLSRYVCARWLPLPALDTSGGNVAQAAVALAVGLGAREIHLAGLDFSCPQGKPYSRGTFLYPIAAAAQSRLLPVESWFQAFLLEGPGGERRTSRPLTLYRQRLEAYARTVPARLSVLPGATAALDLPFDAVSGLPAATDPPPARPAPGFPDLPPAAGPARLAGGPSGTWRAFLQAYAAELRELPEPVEPVCSWYRGLSGAARQACTTLLPAAAALLQDLPPAQRAGHRLLARAREWSLERISRRLEPDS